MFKVICVGLILVIFSGCKPQEDPQQETKSVSIPKVQVQKLVPQVWRQSIRTFGVLEAAETVSISAEFAAKVEEVSFEEGIVVQAGDKLVELDKTELAMLIRQAEADLQSAEVKLQEASSLTKRREELFAKDLVSQEELSVYRTTLANSESKFEQATIGLGLARNNLQRASIISPVSGRVVAKNVEVGEVAMPGRPLAEINVTGTMRVITYVTEQEINSIQVGSDCIVTTPGVRGREYTAHVESRGGEVDSATGNFPVKLILENSDGLLKPGMTAVVTMKGLEVGDILLIPETALVDRNRKRVVFRVVNGIAEEVEPAMAATVSTEWLPVLHGLAAGDEVIVGGLSSVVAGTEVEVVNSAGGGQEESASTHLLPDEDGEVQEGGSN